MKPLSLLCPFVSSLNIPLHLLQPTQTKFQLRTFSSFARRRPTTNNNNSTSPTHPTNEKPSGSSSLSPPPPPPQHLTHLTPSGSAHMVSITHKSPTHRTATAIQTLIFSSSRTHATLISATLQKGDAIAVARIAGIQAAKRTADLIPLAHPGLGIESVEVDILPLPPTHVPGPPVSANPDTAESLTHDDEEIEIPIPEHIKTNAPHGGVFISATVSCTAKTGVEMEALTAANVAGLTMYDMLKGVDKGMSLREGRVVRKSGGKSGGWNWDWEVGRVVKELEGKGAKNSAG